MPTHRDYILIKHCFQGLQVFVYKNHTIFTCSRPSKNFCHQDHRLTQALIHFNSIRSNQTILLLAQLMIRFNQTILLIFKTLIQRDQSNLLLS